MNELLVRTKAELAAKDTYYRQARLQARVITDNPGCFSPAKRAEAAEFLAGTKP